MKNKQVFGLVAHDNKKDEIIKWVEEHKDFISAATNFCTGTTGSLIQEKCGVEVTCLKSGPLGGDQQLGALIAENKLTALFFFIDPLSAHPHDVDVKALIRLCTLYNLPLACNPETANLIINSLKLQNH